MHLGRGDQNKDQENNGASEGKSDVDEGGGEELLPVLCLGLLLF